MMIDMEAVVAWHNSSRPFAMKKIMNIAKCGRTPGKTCKKCEIVIQPAGHHYNTTIENEEQDAVEQINLQFARLPVMMQVASRGPGFVILTLQMHQKTMYMIFHPGPQQPASCKQQWMKYP
jgi:hypothetical protein